MEGELPQARAGTWVQSGKGHAALESGNTLLVSALLQVCSL